MECCAWSRGQLPDPVDDDAGELSPLERDTAARASLLETF
jgi:hypothetical protein